MQDTFHCLQYTLFLQAEVWNVDDVYREGRINPVSSKTVSLGVMCIEPYQPMMVSLSSESRLLKGLTFHVKCQLWC